MRLGSAQIGATSGSGSSRQLARAAATLVLVMSHKGNHMEKGVRVSQGESEIIGMSQRGITWDQEGLIVTRWLRIGQDELGRVSMVR